MTASDSRNRDPIAMGARPWRWLCAGALAAIVLAGWAGMARAEAASSSQPEGHGSAESEAEGPRLGPDLKGFDLTVLRSKRRGKIWRYEIGNIRQTTMPPKQRRVRFGCALEFGSESGDAEARKLEDDLRESIREILSEITSDHLLSFAGKMQIKERIAQLANDMFSTARVRVVYITEFFLETVDI